MPYSYSGTFGGHVCQCYRPRTAVEVYVAIHLFASKLRAICDTSDALPFCLLQFLTHCKSSSRESGKSYKAYPFMPCEVMSSPEGPAKASWVLGPARHRFRWSIGQ